ncbi:MAG TPA: nitrite/sulfite reductase, partial [Blastocatellia bacterium]|nr:nitrite/sulfite reductase [Blastocatellia bacterium]
APYAAHLYSEFLPVEEMFNFSVAVIRVFDRYGERKQRMKARMKFLVQKMGWDNFKEAVDAERKIVGELPSVESYLTEASVPDNALTAPGLEVLNPLVNDAGYQEWVNDNVIQHKIAHLRGVHVRTKLGDITADRARALAEIARKYSSAELRVSIEQNLYLPWVRAAQLPDLYLALKEISLADPGAETVADVTACPGADTCRLGIASAKGLGSAISESFHSGDLAGYRESARELHIKISGCPNGCAQHSIANIGFHAAALSNDGKTVPSHLLFVGGQANHGNPRVGKLIGKFPAKSGIKIVKTLLDLYQAEKETGEEFNAYIDRIGDARVKEVLEPLRAIPSFESDPGFYEDYGHENEKFAVRPGVRGECAGTTIAEHVPTIEEAQEWLAQAEAYLHHKNYEQAIQAAYDAAAAGARVPLYKSLVDPFTSLGALWEFENLYVLSGQTKGEWKDLQSKFDALKDVEANESSAQEIVGEARKFVAYCSEFNPA